VLAYICGLLAERAALLVAVPMAVFLDRMDRDRRMHINRTLSICV
jgi:hypothetical protein